MDKEITPLESWILWLKRRIPNRDIWIGIAMKEVYKEGQIMGALKERAESAKYKGELIGTLKGSLIHITDKEVKERVIKRIKELEDGKINTGKE